MLAGLPVVSWAGDGARYSGEPPWEIRPRPYLPSEQTCTNRFGLRATVGNVREMTSVAGEVRGGSYLDALAPEVMTHTEVVDGPNAFTGFRCVAEARRVTYGG